MSRMQERECPFYIADTRDLLKCEAGILVFADDKERRDVVYQRCALDWQRCTLAQQLMRTYDRIGPKELAELRKKHRIRILNAAAVKLRTK